MKVFLSKELQVVASECADAELQALAQAISGVLLMSSHCTAQLPGKESSQCLCYLGEGRGSVYMCLGMSWGCMLSPYLLHFAEEAVDEILRGVGI